MRPLPTALLVALLGACEPEPIAMAPAANADAAERTLRRLTMTGPASVLDGVPATYTVSGARPNTRVDLWGSLNLRGRGIVFPGNGLTLDVGGPTAFRLTTTSDAAGVATFSVTFTGPVGRRIEIQAFTPVNGNWFVTGAPIIEIVAPRCGDGVVSAPETCDDGNTLDGDGCSAVCVIETCADADGDTVCDVDDVCPGGDDLVDGDANGVPDACDVDCPCWDAATLDAALATTGNPTWLGPGVFASIEYSVEGFGPGPDPIYWRARTGSFGSPPFDTWCDYGAPAPMSQGSALTQWITEAEQQACATLLSTWGRANGAPW